MATQLLEEKREYPRLHSNRLVLMKEDSGETKRLVAVNYSMGGMALHTYAPLPLGEFIDLHFKLDEHDENVLEMTAEVMQNFKSGNAYIAGVKFVGTLPVDTTLGDRSQFVY